MLTDTPSGASQCSMCLNIPVSKIEIPAFVELNILAGKRRNRE